MIAAALEAAAAFTVAHYDCTMETPKAINRSAGNVSISDIGFPDVASDWRFTLALDPGEGGRGINATITWRKDPIQLAGQHAALVTADGSLAFTAFSAGPCMFTESMCMSLVNMARQPDNSVKFVVLPAALASDKVAGARTPFIVIAEGSCKEIVK